MTANRQAHGKAFSTGNNAADKVISYMPVLGTLQDVEEAAENPSMLNIGSAIISTASDLFPTNYILRGIDTLVNTVQQSNKEEYPDWWYNEDLKRQHEVFLNGKTWEDIPKEQLPYYINKANGKKNKK